MKNIAVIGLGGHALKNTLPALTKVPSLNLVGCHTRNREIGSATAENYRIRYWENLNELLASPLVDVVYIATPTGVHYSSIKAALSAGKHVFCEKSLVTTLDETEELCLLAEKNELCLAECFMYKYHVQYRTLKQMLAERIIGKVHAINARFGYPHLDRGNVRYQRALGGGALFDAGAYPLSFLLDHCRGEYLNLSGALQQEQGYEVDTGGGAIMTVEDGCIAQASWGMGRDYCNEIELWGEKGKLVVERAFSKPEILSSKIRVIRNGNVEVVVAGPDNHFVSMFKSFTEAIDSKEAQASLREEILRISKTLSALRR